ncbi:hypothetical protein L1987_60904 [Smallanthus sonchifolius]|uniref:Uncharacterized protein n=1 Tax=Smallanthus sonchifolius TaxID=185202 RepID=A0ACB9D999_9ASTR|nr:hypothetical protein L1987_60904 [Smallanthus sonchifolius]
MFVQFPIIDVRSQLRYSPTNSFIRVGIQITNGQPLWSSCVKQLQWRLILQWGFGLQMVNHSGVHVSTASVAVGTVSPAFRCNKLQKERFSNKSVMSSSPFVKMFDRNPPTVTWTVITALRLVVLTVPAVVDSLAMA